MQSVQSPFCQRPILLDEDGGKQQPTPDEVQHALLTLAKARAPDSVPQSAEHTAVTLRVPDHRPLLPPAGCLIVTDSSGRQFVTSSKLLYRPMSRPQHADMQLISDFAKNLKKAIQRVEGQYGAREVELRREQQGRQHRAGSDDEEAQVERGPVGRKGPK